MKKAIVLGICICVLATGCQNAETGSEKEITKTEQDNKEQKVYLEKGADLGLNKQSSIRLVAESDGMSGKKLYVDNEEIDLTQKIDSQENCQHVQVFTQDIDKDGRKEIVTAFYGGAGGTVQQFCMLKYFDGEWKIVEEKEAPLDSSVIEIEKKSSKKVVIKVTNSDFEQEIFLADKDKIRDVSDVHIEARSLEVSKTGISVSAVLINQAHEGKLLGNIQQKLCYDSKTKKLKIKETKFEQRKG